MDQALINTAIESLELLTIKLHSSKLERAENFVLGELDVEFGFQYLKTVYSETYDAVTEDESHYQMLRVFPKFGVRGVSPKITKKKGKNAGTPDVFFTLEALFR